MAEKRYHIGEFACINKLTARMLRHYDRMGLLKPEEIAENGYRMYSSAQIPRAALIKKYRECEISLDEIAELLSADEQRKKELVKGKLAALSQSETARQAVKAELAHLAGEQSEEPKNLYEIAFCRRAGQTAISLPGESCEDTIERDIASLIGSLQKSGIKPAGLLTVLSDWQSGTLTPAFPILNGGKPDGHRITALEEGWYLTTFHYGEYSALALGYDRLIRFAEENGYRLKMPFIERYYLDAAHTHDPREYITEISVRIEAE